MSWNNRDLDDQFGRPVYPTKSDEPEEERVCGWGEGTAQQQIEGSMTRQLNSTKQSLRLIAQSEEIGITAAQELDQQGEQLDNIEKNLDKVNTDVRATQKHLDSIKSVFGGLKNWFTGANKTAEEERKKTEEASRQRLERKREEESKLQKVINENQRISTQQRQTNMNMNDNIFDQSNPMAKHEAVLNENLGKNLYRIIREKIILIMLDLFWFSFLFKCS
ncbi:unnamed protein product [Dimorphilus gyrociliatus]|uniref:t-SNARE coiled-coil homology domain-containing protein n=1 Tax=Dimorphilus gyrociliatus TaxID=2664684 RepID=A0A7I8WCH3_9ANNE|nr:unnamed protein product [Dimorphilus gyrociliatus]